MTVDLQQSTNSERRGLKSHQSILSLNTTLTIFMLVLLIGCRTVKLESKYDPSIEFSRYKSFCWLGGCDFKYDGSLDSVRVEVIKIAIENELVDKGFIKDDNDPDFLVGFHVWITKELSERPHFESDYDFWPSYRQDAYKTGLLTVDIANADDASMIWQSNTKKYLNLDERVNLKEIRRIVKLTFRDFPPDPK